MEKTIKIESFDVEFISRKMNDYKQIMFYFKISRYKFEEETSTI